MANMDLVEPVCDEASAPTALNAISVASPITAYMCLRGLKGLRLRARTIGHKVHRQVSCYSTVSYFKQVMWQQCRKEPGLSENATHS